MYSSLYFTPAYKIVLPEQFIVTDTLEIISFQQYFSFGSFPMILFTNSKEWLQKHVCGKHYKTTPPSKPF